MSKEKRLGRGLEALLGRFTTDDNNSGDVSGTDATDSALVTISQIDLIDLNPYQPRKEFNADELASLSESLKTHGLLQPLVVRSVGGRYQLIAGERRLRAAKLASWSEVAVRVVDADDRQMAEIALTENLQRRDLNPLEKAAALAQYLATHGGRHEDLAQRLSMERASVTNLLRLLESPVPIQDAIRSGEISAGHARAMLGLPETTQLEFAQRITSEHWNVRTTEEEVRKWNQCATESWSTVDRDGECHVVTTNKDAAQKSAQTIQIEQELRTALGVKVTIKHKHGKGKITIPFTNHAEFERLYAQLCKTPSRKTG